MKIIQLSVLAMLLVVLSGCSSPQIKEVASSGEPALVFYNGTIFTMEGKMADATGQSYPESQVLGSQFALLVEDGKIAAIDRYETVVNRLQGKNVRYIDLDGQALLPGFIEPHAHLYFTVAGGAVTNLIPCIPDKYQAHYEEAYGWLYQKGGQSEGCLLYIDDAFKTLAKSETLNGWYVGNGLDPSRMMLKEGMDMNKNRKYLEFPAYYLQQYPQFETHPVFILDQSGHLGYVNEQAFDSAEVCNKTFDMTVQTFEQTTGIQLTREQKQFMADNQGRKMVCQGTKSEMKLSQQLVKFQYFFLDGSWEIVELSSVGADDEVWGYSGLLKEESSFMPFAEKAIGNLMEPSEPAEIESLEENMIRLLNVASQQGVTTFVEGGGSSKSMIDSYRSIATQADMPARLRVLYTWDAQGYEFNPPKVAFTDAEYQGMFSAEGIKLWADGSTQGCSAGLSQSYDEYGLCDSFGDGHQNFSAQGIAENLERYAKAQWYINIHANGDKAIENSIEAFRTLAQKHPSFRHVPSTLIHSTVNSLKDGQLTIPEKIRKARRLELPQLSSSHLPAHVAYWGKAMENELGEARGAEVLPMQTEWKLGVPLSLHSDMSVSPLVPLWFVEQAVTRRTWQYPNLAGDGVVMNKAEQLSPYQALMAVTINAAKQHNLDKYVGSLAVGKVADLVVLGKNPLEAVTTEIHDIPVSCTFLSGKQVQWRDPNNDWAPKDTPDCNLN